LKKEKTILKPSPVSKRNREEKENSILNAAREIFCEKGFELATTKEIAAKAGCAEGLIFKYFEGKVKLLIRLVEKGLLNAQEELLSLPEHINSLEEDLHIICTWIAKSFLQERQIFQIYMSLRLSGDTYVTKSLIREEFVRIRNETIINRFKKHQDLGHLKKGLDLEFLFEEIHSYIHYICVILPVYRSEDVIKQTDAKIKQFLSLLFYGLCQKE
jgi:AcrR family transcriptional regulator